MGFIKARMLRSFIFGPHMAELHFRPDLTFLTIDHGSRSYVFSEVIQGTDIPLNIFVINVHVLIYGVSYRSSRDVSERGSLNVRPFVKTGTNLRYAQW